MSATRTTRLATLALIGITAIWGSTFFVIKDAVGAIDPVDFLAVRFTIAAVTAVAFCWRRLRRLTRRQWAVGLALGTVFAAAQITQTVGLLYTSASVSGFITGTYVILTPLILWLGFGARLRPATWVAVTLAIAGLAVLGLNGFDGNGLGEALTLAGAVLFSLHIILLDRWAQAADALSLSVVQLIALAVICAALGAPGGYPVPSAVNVWAAIAYTAIAAGLVTLLAQTWAQQHVPPTRVALLMTLEPVFASTFAVTLGGEEATPRLLLGGTLIVAGTIVGVSRGQAQRKPHPLPDRHD